MTPTPRCNGRNPQMPSYVISRSCGESWRGDFRRRRTTLCSEIDERIPGQTPCKLKPSPTALAQPPTTAFQRPWWLAQRLKFLRRRTQCFLNLCPFRYDNIGIRVTSYIHIGQSLFFSTRPTSGSRRGGGGPEHIIVGRPRQAPLPRPCDMNDLR